MTTGPTLLNGMHLLPGALVVRSHLQAKYRDVLVRTRAAFEACFDGCTLETSVAFPFTGQNAPYYVHALLVTGDETVYGCHDFTSVGTAPPASICPGSIFAFPKFRLPSALLPFDCRFLLWGTP